MSITTEASRAATRGAGQATLVEQSRAIAEVQAAVVVAQNRPRSTAQAMREMREVCGIPALADRAFFRFSRAGSAVTGETVHLARELARVWGNVTFGIAEMARDDARGQSEMLAFAWDLQTNARSQTTFIVPHVRDTKQGPKPMTDMRDIYENNANMGARRLREMIFAVLPVWFREEAADLCRRTLEEGGGVPLVKRIADCLGAFEGIGVTRAQIEAKIGTSADAMLPEQVAALGITFKSIRRGEVRKEEEFPPVKADVPQGDKLTALEAALDSGALPPPEPAPATPTPEGPEPPPPPAAGQAPTPPKAPRRSVADDKAAAAAANWQTKLRACTTEAELERITRDPAFQNDREWYAENRPELAAAVGKTLDEAVEELMQFPGDRP